MHALSRMKRKLPDWRAERNSALSALDMEWARRTMPDASSDDVRLLAMHKARYECTDLADELRHTSAAFLVERGSTRFNGEPLLPLGLLPR